MDSGLVMIHFFIIKIQVFKINLINIFYSSSVSLIYKKRNFQELKTITIRRFMANSTNNSDSV
jgi:Na+/H+ antiporter NhaC